MDAKQFSVIAGAGGDGPMPEGDLKALLVEMERIANKSENYARLRLDARRTRFNAWIGQAPDGRQHGDYMQTQPKPFEGASDQRVYLTDMLVNEKVMLAMAAMFRAQISCQPVGGAADPDRARKMTVLLRWLIGRMGTRWFEQHAILAGYVNQNSPAVGLMRLGWRTDETLVMRKVTVADLATLAAQSMAGARAGSPAEARRRGVGEETGDSEQLAVSSEQIEQELTLAIQGQQQDEDLAALVKGYFPDLTLARAAKVIRQLRKDGVAEFPQKQKGYSGPTCRAEEFGVDFHIPDNTRDFNRVRAWFEVEWMSEAELRGKIVEDGWDEKFVEEVLKHEGVSAFGEYLEDRMTGRLIPMGEELHKGEYQVIWCWFEAVNEDDGVKAKYYAVVHRQAEKTAFGRRLFRTRGSTWNAVLHRRENLDQYVLNDRGIPEISGPDQWILKLMRDLPTDNAHVGAVPPVVSAGMSNKGRILMKQLGHIPLGRVGATLHFLNPPAFPAASFRVMDEIQKATNERWGRPAETGGAHELSVQVTREVESGLFVSRLRDTCQILLDLAFENMDDATLAQVLDEAGTPIARSMAEIEGQYEAQVMFDPNDLDYRRLTEIAANLMQHLMQMDSEHTLDTREVVCYFVRALLPQLARNALRPAGAGIQQELKDEAENLKTLRIGLVPQMDSTGKWDYAARANMYDEMEASSRPIAAPWDPSRQIAEVWADWPPMQYGNLLQWRMALAKQAQQFGANAQIGRSMVKDAQGVTVEG